MSVKTTEIRLRSPQDGLLEILVQSGVRPSLLLELLYYAGEPDLVAAMRAVAALDPPTRLRVLSIARGMAYRLPGAAQAERKVDA